MVRQLVLHARDPGHEMTSMDDLVAMMVRMGLIGPAMDDQDGAFYAGEAFLSHITFLGCSPQIDLVPADDAARRLGHFCHVRLQAAATLQFRVAPGAMPPRCPGCRADVPGWEARVADFLATGEGCYSCGKCHASSPISALHWRQSAGFGRWFLEIWNVHPYEAVPSEPLLAALEQAAGTRLEYFYQ